MGGDIAAGLSIQASAPVMTRPANTTAYASGDLIANDTTAASVVPLEFVVSRDIKRGVTISRCRIRKSGTSVTGAAMRLHLFTEKPAVTNGDNGVWLASKSAAWAGCLDVSEMKAFSDGAAGIGVPQDGTTVTIKPGVNKIWGLLEARGALPPASGETFQVTLEGYAD